MRTQQIEILFPASVRITGTGVTDTGVEYIDIVHGPFLVAIGNFTITSQQGGIVNRPVVIGILQCQRSGTTATVEGYISFFHQLFRPVVIRDGRAADHCFQHFIFIQRQAFCHGISQYGYRMITDHTPVLVCHMAPHRQCLMYALFAMFQHGTGNIGIHLPLDDIK